MAWDYYKHKVTMKEQATSFFLKYLNDNSYKTGIGTSNSRELVGLIIDKFEIGDYIHAIRTSCEVQKGKPSPDVYLKVAQDLGVKPEECLVFFEDIDE